MNAKPLFVEDKTDVVAYFCSECRIVKKTSQEAEDCCKPKLCDCGKEVRQYYSVCDTCLDISRIKKEKEKLSKATRIKVPTTDAVYSEGASNEGYVFFDGLEDEFEDDSEMPLYVYDCTMQTWGGLDLDEILENAFDGDWHEDAVDSVVKHDELAKYLKSWNEKQDLYQYMVATDRIIVLDEEKFNSWLAE